jgi:hypothetical protein
MNMASSETIAAILSAESCGRPAGVRRRGAANVPLPAIRNRRRRCQCGHCRECADNARWERIFAEKFADPDYYCGPVMRAASPLVSI